MTPVLGLIALLVALAAVASVHVAVLARNRALIKAALTAERRASEAVGALRAIRDHTSDPDLQLTAQAALDRIDHNSRKDPDL